MPAPVNSGYTPAGVDVSGSEGARSTIKQAASKMAQTAKRLGTKLLPSLAKHSEAETDQAGIAQPIRNMLQEGEPKGPLGPVLQRLSSTENTMAFKNIDSKKNIPVAKQLIAQSSLASLDRLKAIVSNSICSARGIVNMVFIEHFCGLVYKADEASPNFRPQYAEGKTTILAPHRDFTFAMIHHEMELIDSIIKDIEQNSGSDGSARNTCTAMKKVLGTLTRSADLMSKISRHAVFGSQGNNASALLKVAKNCAKAARNLPIGEKLLIPLTFYAYGEDGASGTGHATYMVVEKSDTNKVNLHMVNRGSGSMLHRVKPGEEYVDGQHRKKESAVSKWNVPIDQPGGFDHNFLTGTFLLTLDAKFTPGGQGIVESFHADPTKQMLKNIKDFYLALEHRVETGPPPPKHQPIYQRPQKDGNCAYANLKASMRHLLGDQAMYNKIDVLKIEKVAQRTLKYMKDNLLGKAIPDTAPLERLSFNADAAVKKLLAKHDKALHRIALDNGDAMPLKLPPHLQKVTN